MYKSGDPRLLTNYRPISVLVELLQLLITNIVDQDVSYCKLYTINMFIHL